MKLLRGFATLLIFLCAVCRVPDAGAATLRALVAEIHDGRSLTVVVSNRRFKVVLRGVVVAEPWHEDGAVAQRHLSGLVLGREVLVEYTQINAGSVYGRVYLDGRDVGLQIVRDGAAWLDRAVAGEFAELERKLYYDSERAAREEGRGVWRPSRAEEQNVVSVSVRPSVAATGAKKGAAKERAPGVSLNSEDLLFLRRAAPAGGAAGGATPGAGRTPSAPKPTRKPLNRPGEDYDYSEHLADGRVSVVYFYAQWCPACRGLTPVMERINNTFPDLQVLFMDIDEWGSPVAVRHNVNFVPYLKIYDESGSLVSEGERANDWLRDAIKQRSGAKVR